MHLSKLHPRHLWSTESGLTGLLIFFLGYLIVVTTLDDFSFGMYLSNLFFSLIIVAGVVTTFKQRWLHGFVIALAAVILALTWVEEFRPDSVITILNTGLSLIFLGFLLAVVVLQVFREGPVTGHRLRGAIVVYLLLGAVWALAFQMVALSSPGAFRFPDDLAAGSPNAVRHLLIYFSYITLTTTGYGDITPVHPLARLLTMFEAMVGQLYLAVTLARLVSLAVMSQKEKI
jgi:hypothetical protein